MGVLTEAGKNLALDAVAEVGVYVALHDDDPGSAGANNELSGGTPAYARKAIAWSAASSGNADSSSQPEFDIPSGSTVSHFSIWSAATEGTCYAVGALSASEVFAAQGTYTLTDADLTLSDPA